MSSVKPILVPADPGELLDKTILKIKAERIGDEEMLRDVQAEMEVLRSVRGQATEQSELLSTLPGQLEDVNRSIWEFEDEIRVCERRKDFGQQFI